MADLHREIGEGSEDWEVYLGGYAISESWQADDQCSGRIYYRFKR
jgi:hypothetical protein